MYAIRSYYDIYFSLVYRRVLEIPGVQRIQSLQIYLDGEPQSDCTDLSLEADVLLYSTDHEVEVF